MHWFTCLSDPNPANIIVLKCHLLITAIAFIQNAFQTTFMRSTVGRALDWGLKGCYFKTHSRRSHCVVTLSKTLYLLLSFGSIQEGLAQHDRKTADWDVKTQTEQK